MKRKPRIGLTMRLELETNRFYLGRDYCEALEGLGAIPLHIPLIPKREYLREVLENLDGILLPGSDTDVDPLRFGEQPHPKLQRIIFEKEETDLIVLEEAEKLKLPILGICFGMQVLNVFRGGTLIQDIESQVPNCIKHQQGISLARNSHNIDVESESILSSLFEDKNVTVNSHHHQAIGKIGKDLKATAWAKDGVVECIEDTRRETFILGVQWHPELSWKTDSLSNKIFETFINECIKTY
jgi:putative glutamine amidotransferase